MRTHEFFAKYANTPLDKRFIVIDFNGLNMSLYGIYERMKSLETIMLPMRIEQEKLITEAEKMFNLSTPVSEKETPSEMNERLYSETQKIINGAGEWKQDSVEGGTV